MTKPFIIRPISWLVAPEDNPRIYGEHGYTISIDDEGGGEYIRIREHDGDGDRQISIDAEHWSEIQKAVGSALYEIQQYERGTDD